ncbi:MAG: DedA family protein [Acidimicrobiia bacterium]|nr:DedA family protein [Acidimicrobiia bacterium]
MVANVLTDLTDWLDEISGNWWFLLVIFAIAFLDSVVPVVPSETAVILGGVAAGAGDQSLPLVIVAGALGAFIGDNTAYTIGRRFSGRFERRAEHKQKTAHRLNWAREQIRTRGGLLLITARFIPGGRTALTVTSGITRQPRAWFAGWVALAAVIWASYAAGLGAVFGRRFKDNHTLAFLLAFGAALSITVVIEVIRHLRSSAAEEGPAPLP